MNTHKVVASAQAKNLVHRRHCCFAALDPGRPKSRILVQIQDKASVPFPRFQELSEVFLTATLISAAARRLRRVNPFIYKSTANQFLDS